MAKLDMGLKVGSAIIINVKMEDIEVGERFRKDMGDIEALAQSISKDGLIQPIAIAWNYKSPEDLALKKIRIAFIILLATCIVPSFSSSTSFSTDSIIKSFE